MARKHSKTSLRRKNVQSRVPAKFIIYVEGKNTEPSYLNLLRTNSKVIPHPVEGKGIGSCEQFVETSNKAYNNLSPSERAKYSQKWLISELLSLACALNIGSCCILLTMMALRYHYRAIVTPKLKLIE